MAEEQRGIRRTNILIIDFTKGFSKKTVKTLGCIVFNYKCLVEKIDSAVGRCGQFLDEIMNQPSPKETFHQCNSNVFRQFLHENEQKPNFTTTV